MLVGAEAIIDEARNGRMFILVDDDDRENEGDLVIPAQMATPDAINFMARHGRGLICLALGKERVDQLGLEPMARINRTSMETAFTVSIEARDGVTTGISAADRARTIAVAIDANNGPDAIVSPGHVFPLVARPGGVLVRAGHTEAAVDVARLAGLNPSGVICEIMREDGTMARLDDLMEFAATHGLKIGTIRDLIAYRLKKDHMVERVAETRFTRAAARNWAAKVFRDKASGEEQLALVHGAIDPASRPWSGCTASTCSPTCSASRAQRSGLLDGAMAMIEAEGAGVVVALHAASPGSLSRDADLRSGKPARRRRPALARLWHRRADPRRARHPRHGPAVNTRHSPVGLSAYGLAIVEERCIAGRRHADGPRPDRRSPLLPASERHAAGRRARARSRRPAMSMRRSPSPARSKCPGAIALAAESGRYCAFVALGVVIRGETYHFEIVANESARGADGPDALTALPSATAS